MKRFQQFNHKKQLLEKLLKKSFAYGASAFRYGLFPEGISDHLPIMTSVMIKDEPVRMMSWNLLADEHLYNNFMNISGSHMLEIAMDKALGGKSNNIYHGKMYHFFSEISQFLRTHHKNHAISTETFKKFVELKQQGSLLSRSRDPRKVQQKEQQVQKARQAFVALMCATKPHPNHHDFLLALQHSYALILQIQGGKDSTDDTHGALQWRKRYQRLLENRALVNELREQDILAFQECTQPQDICRLLAGKNMAVMSFSVRAPKALGQDEPDAKPEHPMVAMWPQKGYCHQQALPGIPPQHLEQSGQAAPGDHAVLAYSKTLFKPLSEPLVFTLGHGKKPAIIIKLQHRQTNQVYIVGSIHHPGGKIDQRGRIQQAIEQLQPKHKAVTIMIGGDYNHTLSQFLDMKSEQQDLAIQYPNDGTMAGSDYQNNNQAIDGFLTNQSNLEVSISHTLARCKPASAIRPLDLQLGRNVTTKSSTLLPHIPINMDNCNISALKVTKGPLKPRISLKNI